VGCAFRAPRLSLFSDDLDSIIPINLSGLIGSEISGAFCVNTRYFVDPGRSASMTDLEAEDDD